MPQFFKYKNNYNLLVFSLTGEKIFPLVWEVIETMELYDIPVVSLTSDGAKPNRRFYSLCQGKSKDLPYKTFNPYREGEDVYFFCDAPHLLKTARNCFSNSFAHSKSRRMQVCFMCTDCRNLLFAGIVISHFIVLCRNKVN